MPGSLPAAGNGIVGLARIDVDVPGTRLSPLRRLRKSQSLQDGDESFPAWPSDYQ